MCEIHDNHVSSSRFRVSCCCSGKTSDFMVDIDDSQPCFKDGVDPMDMSADLKYEKPHLIDEPILDRHILLEE